LKIASQLRELTSYCAVRENDTRWSSTYNMIARFLKIQNALSGIVELLSLLPNHLEVDVLKRAFVSMKKFDSITVMLQQDGLTFVEARETFDLFLKDYPDFAHYISAEADIVENETFEKAVMQISRGGEPLSEEHRQAALPLLLQPPEEQVTHVVDEAVGNDNNDNVPYSQELRRKLKRQKIVSAATEKQDIYINLDVLPATSVNCERLFSAAKFILSDTRKRTSPTLFEALLLLKVNASFWNAISVGQAMGRTKHRVQGGDTDDADGSVDADGGVNADDMWYYSDDDDSSSSASIT
jgi:hypothetical protein